MSIQDIVDAILQAIQTVLFLPFKIVLAPLMTIITGFKFPDGLYVLIEEKMPQFMYNVGNILAYVFGAQFIVVWFPCWLLMFTGFIAYKMSVFALTVVQKFIFGRL